MDKKRAAAYIRVSTEEQVEFSPKSQLEKIFDFAKRNGYVIPDEFIFTDEGISGRNTKNREAFNRMIAAAKSKPRPFDIILVWKFSRFARNREDSIVYKSMLKKEFGIRVISVSEDVGDDKMSVLFESMIEAMDEYYSLNLAEEVRRGMTERIKQGKPCAVAPFGYEMRDKSLFPVESEAEIIRKVFKAFVNGESTVEIARRLNEMGIRTHRGNKIENRTVEYWLNNPVYIGKVRWNPDGKTARYHWNDEQIIISDGEHKGIIEKELWDAAEERILAQEKRKRRIYECRKSSSWLVGILQCGICGGTMVNCGGYFYCLKKTKGSCIGNGGVNVKKLENEIVKLISQIAYPAEFEILHCKNSDDVSKKLENERKKLLRIKRAYEDGIDTLCEYKNSKEKILKEINRLENAVKEKIPQEKCVLDILTSKTVGNEKKCLAVRDVISRIEKIGKEEYNIFLNFGRMEDQTENWVHP